MSSKFWDILEKVVAEPCREYLETGVKTRKVPVNLRAGDVLVMGSMKTGTTWTQQICHQVRTGGDEDFGDIYDVAPFIPFFYMDVPGLDLNREQKASPRVFKSHETYETLPKAEGVKYIVVTRDPTDCLFSMIKFLRRYYSNEDADMTLEDIQRFLQSPMVKVTGSNQEFIVSWWPHRNDPNVMWLFFEDMVADLPGSVDRIAKFMGVELSPEGRTNVLKNSTFEYMAAHKDKFKGEETFVAKPFAELAWKPQMGMVRPDGGKIGQGRQGLHPGIVQLLEGRWKEIVQPVTGYASYAEMYQANSALQKKK
jgi:hypothetical protein